MSLQIYGADGARLSGELEEGAETCGVATDPAGNVYVGVYPETINKYVPSANPPVGADKSGSGTVGHGICNVAADALGNVYAANYGGAGLFKLEGLSDTAPSEVDPGSATMAVELNSDDIFADRGGEVVQYSAAGTSIRSFAEGEISGSHGIGVNAGGSEVYVATSSKVKIFGPLANVEPPKVIMGPVTEVGYTTAQVTGEVDPEGFSTSCVFEYVTEAHFEAEGFEDAPSTPCANEPGSGSSLVPVEAELEGITPSAEYVVRLSARNGGGKNVSAEPSPVFTTSPVGPPNVSAEEASMIGATSVRLSGHIDPNAPAGNPPAFDVTWHFQCTPACSGVEGHVAASSQSELVEGTATGLLPGTNYSFTLVAENAGGKVSAPARTFTTEPALPAVSQEFASKIVDGGSTLTASIDSGGAPTIYYFEYMLESAYLSEGFEGTQSIVTPEAGPLPGDLAEHVVSTQISGLVSGEKYVFRALAKNAVGTGKGAPVGFSAQGAYALPQGECPNEAFRTGEGAKLPDCRAYEEASPLDKGGLSVGGLTDLFASSSDGSRVSFYQSYGSGIPAGGGGHQDFLTMLAARSGEGWSTQRLLPPEVDGETAGYLGASENMKFALVFGGLTGLGTGSGQGLYLIDTTTGSLTTIVGPEEDPNSNISESDYYYDAISADGSRVFFESRAPLAVGAAPGYDNLYVWDRSTGEVSLAGLLPSAEDGNAPPAGSFGGSYSWMEGKEPAVGGAAHGIYVEAVHAATSDGGQIYFTAGETGQLYLRRGFASGDPTTVHVSEPEAGLLGPSEEHPAAFQEATPNGEYAFFTSREKLTANATVGAFGEDLYRFDSRTGELVDIAPDSLPEDENGANVKGVLGVSADGTSGFFVARGTLAPGGESGQNNLYHFAEEGAGFAITFVAQLAEEQPDTYNWSQRSGGPLGGTENTAVGRASRVSADGRTVLFSSIRPLTGFANDGCGVAGNGPCRELYLWSVGFSLPICISCNPTGEIPASDAQLSPGLFNAHLEPRSGHIKPWIPRNMSADGSRVFFESPDPLLPADTNGVNGCKFVNPEHRANPECMDVYEWEAPGAPGGSCQVAEVNGGCLYLLSTGDSPEPSAFIDASADGSDVFIATSSRSVPADRDDLDDVYDVRTNGGLASQQVQPAMPCSSSEACSGSTTGSPAASTPGTSTFQGSGNPKQAPKGPCKKGSKRRCTKQHKKKQHKKKAKTRPAAGTRKAK